MIFCQECDHQISIDVTRTGNPWYHVNTAITDHEAEPSDW